MAPPARFSKDYAVHRKICGLLTIICLLVTVAGGLIGGASWQTIVWRSSLVSMALLLGTRFLLRAWISWEAVARSESSSEEL